MEAVVDASGAASAEALLPAGARARQLSVRTLLVGTCLALADGRPAQLTRVLGALSALDEREQRRLGVLAQWQSGPHRLSYRQVEHTARLLSAALAKVHPDGGPSAALARFSASLLEASVPPSAKARSGSLAVDWTDLETFGRPPVPGLRPSADPEASWGHRRGDGPGQKDEVFFGYYLSAATTVKEESGPAVPELVRRAALSSCQIDPVPTFVPVLEEMAASGTALTDVLADSGYAHRVAENWALRLRAMGASIVTDLHPSDRGPRGTFCGAICSNGNLYCPAAPKALLGLGPLPRDASAEKLAEQDKGTGELAHYKFARISAYDKDGYHRVACPAAAGKLRCPLRAASMALSHEHPEVLAPPPGPPTCCSQLSFTVPPTVNAKTAQKHDYPSAAWRASYARRTAVERSYSTIKDPASNDVSRGWCRLMGLSAITIFVTCCLVVRNLRALDAFEARAAEDARRQALGSGPKPRRRRRKPLGELTGNPTPP